MFQQCLQLLACVAVSRLQHVESSGSHNVVIVNYGQSLQRWRPDHYSSNDTIRVGAMLDLHSNARYTSPDLDLARGYVASFDNFDIVNGGLLVNGVRKPLELSIVDTEPNEAAVRAAVEYFANEGIDLLLGPSGDRLAEAAAEVANRTGALIIMPAARTQDVFVSRQFVFGAALQQGKLESIFDLLSSSQTNLSVGVIQHNNNNSDRIRSLCDYVPDFAASYGIQYNGAANTSSNQSSLLRSTWNESLDKHDALQTDVLFACIPDTMCTSLIDALETVPYSPKSRGGTRLL